MYRLFVLALVMTLTVAFSGCGAKQDTPAPTEGEAASSSPDEESTEAPPAATSESGAEAGGSEEGTGGEEAKADEDIEEEDWGEFEVVPSASASAQKKE
ncbi:MAG: hypothetical protein R6V12_19950 [Candidatus Hydrogenedentota bacterium]